MTVRGYRLAVDWAGDNSFAGTYDDVTADLLADPDLAFGYGRDMDNPLGMSPAGKMSFRLKNFTDRYSPDYASSPIFGRVSEGRKVRLVGTDAHTYDTFTRSTSSGWGTSTSGHAYTVSGGSAADYSVNGTVGQMSLTSTNVARTADLAATRYDATITAQITVPALAAGAALEAGFYLRRTSSTAYYLAKVRFALDSSVTVVLVENTGSGEVELAASTVAGNNYTGGAVCNLTVEAVGQVVRAKAWLVSAYEPQGWTVQVTDASHTSGTVRAYAMRLTGNTNGTVAFGFDNLEITGPVLFAGVIDSISLDPDSAGKPVTFDCVDAWGRPGAEKISTPLFAGVRTGDAINVVLDQVGWPQADRSVDPGATIMEWWWEDDTDAASAVEKLLNSEGPPAHCYVEGGIFVFRDRHHRELRTRSTTVQASYTMVTPPTALPANHFRGIKGFGYDSGLTHMVNAVSFVVDDRAVQGFGEVWSTDATFVLVDGETQLVEAAASDPFFAAVTPELEQDYVVTSGTVTVALSRTSGQSTTIFVTAVGSDAVVVGMRLRGYPVTVARSYRVAEEDSLSISRYGRQTYDRDPGWANRHDAKAIAQALIAGYSYPRPLVTFVLCAVAAAPASGEFGAAYKRQILDRRVGDKVTVRNDRSAVNDDYFIERVDHRILKLGARHDVTIGLRAVGNLATGTVFRFDTAGAGFNQGVFGYLGISDPATVFVFDAASGVFNTGVFGN